MAAVCAPCVAARYTGGAGPRAAPRAARCVSLAQPLLPQPQLRSASALLRLRPAARSVRAAPSAVAVRADLRNYDWPQGACCAAAQSWRQRACVARLPPPRARADSAAASRRAALLFDCDGVLADTERDGHRVTFNAAFRQKGLTCEWSVQEYGELLKIGGGKERMTKYFSDHADAEPFKSLRGEAERAAFVAELHKLKTALFVELVERGELPLRPGVARLVAEAREAGVKARCCCSAHATTPGRRAEPARTARADCCVQHQQRGVCVRHRARRPGR